MPKAKSKVPNALKHGVFSRQTLIPGEDGEVYLELWSALKDEWNPEGATEEDAVVSIARAIWRKRRLQKFLQARLLKNSSDINHPSFDVALGLYSFAWAMDVQIKRGKQPEKTFADYAPQLLRSGTIAMLQDKYPRAAFATGTEWAAAIVTEINSNLLPRLTDDDPEVIAKEKWRISLESFTNDEFGEELAIDERLEAMIDRAIKRLIQLKAMKQILGQAPAERPRRRQLTETNSGRDGRSSAKN
jgi:hypothetical protein